ncbi:cupin domain-containing protein [Pararhodonellum marinum]|uniref:cupin domain-containing protein n=1 Tax=Pararhodonellum marinum TaxID=2755358 RepID=UPI00188E74B4|nr:cupin domain-containing protein [Pararhodonellum marinum]
MTNRISFLIQKLGLKEHPEGGYYSETYRALETKEFSMGHRSLMTSIYFLMTSDKVSHFHRIKSDELWFYHEGSPLTIHLLEENGYSNLKVGTQLNQGQNPFQMVRSHAIFGSTVDEADSYSLVSCVVAPGFDFEDFELLKEAELLARWPEQSEIIKKLTVPD